MKHLPSIEALTAADDRRLIAELEICEILAKLARVRAFVDSADRLLATALACGANSDADDLCEEDVELAFAILSSVRIMANSENVATRLDEKPTWCHMVTQQRTTRRVIFVAFGLSSCWSPSSSAFRCSRCSRCFRCFRCSRCSRCSPSRVPRWRWALRHSPVSSWTAQGLPTPRGARARRCPSILLRSRSLWTRRLLTIFENLGWTRVRELTHPSSPLHA